MNWRRQRVGFKRTDPAIGSHEIKTWLPPQQMRYPDRATEMSKTDATAHADVLAGIDELARSGIAKRTGTAAQAIARFQQRHAEAARSECGCEGKTSQAGPNDEDTIRHAQESYREQPLSGEIK